MKKKLALLAAPIVLLAASAATADWGFTPYVGADAEFRHMELHKDFGGNMFTHNYPQGNLYVGAQLNEYFGIEAGYEATKRKARATTLKNGDTVAGLRLQTTKTLQFNAVSQIKALHANLVGFLPICEQYRLKLIGSLGLARLKMKFTELDVAIDGDAVVAGNDDTVTFRKRKNVLRLGLGLQHMINCDWGVRGMLKWEQTNKLRQVFAKEDLRFSIKPKNSVIYSIGAFYTF